MTCIVYSTTLRCIVIFIFLYSGSCYEAGSITTTVYFGGAPDCSPSQCNSGSTHVNNVACSNGKGSWNSGIGIFNDPIPPNKGYVMQRFNATMYLSLFANAEVIMIMIGDAIAAILDVPYLGTACSNCVTPYVFPTSRSELDGVGGYAYQGENAVNLVGLPPSNVFCVSQVDMTIFYGPGSATTNTTLYVFGGTFKNATAWSCKFDESVRAPALWLNDTALTCVIPPSTSKFFPTNVTVEVSSDGVGFTFDGVTFEYTSPPTDNTPHPLAWWFWLTIGICVFSVLSVAIAGYVYAKRHRAKPSDYSLVDENSKLINSAKFKSFGTVQPVDISEITIQQRIGRGSCAEVFTGVWRGTTVAIKKAKVYADDDETFFMELAQEASIMSGLRHPNVLQFLGTASNPPEILIIMEFMARGSLYRIIHDRNVDLSWPRVKAIALDIARGMNYLHCSDPTIIHRDLKSHNLLVGEHFKVKVCDFGLSAVVKRKLGKTTAMTPVGTPCWTAPEVLRNEIYTERADVFSYGVVLWELTTRQDPYAGMPTFQIVIAVGQHKMRPLIPDGTTIPAAFTQLMSDCWNEDPALRPPFSEIVSRLEKM